MGQNLKITVDKAKCLGCGTCAALCPKVFKIAETPNGMKAEVIDPNGDTKENIQMAADSCPVAAITIAA